MPDDQPPNRPVVEPVEAFTAVQPRLLGIAYRMLGTMADAEDVVGDVAERWLAADHSSIDVPEAWLVTAVSRRSLDVLKSARRQREDYPGVWMPEPVCTTGSSDPSWYLEQADGLSTGFLLVLERLTPLVHPPFPLADAAGAHRALEARETAGKVVLVP